MTSKRRRSTRTKTPAAAAAAKPSEPASAPNPKPKRRGYTRPGVEAAARLASLRPASDHVDAWERASSRYVAMLKAKGGAGLANLDERREEMADGWREARSAAGSGGDEATAAALTRDQLLNIVIEWKFSKGKPRHALKPLLKSNSDASVSTAARRAFEAADGVPAGDAGGARDERTSLAVKELCALRGVGPATASAVLCLYRPDAFAFMDDEVIECLYDGKRGYTPKIYKEVNDRCGEIAAELNDADRGGPSRWTACEVGKALWAVATMSATNDEDGLSAIFGDGGPDSRKRTKKGR